MEAQWYYSQGGRRCGPISTRQLKELAAAGQLQPTDLIWKEGMPKWIAAGKTKGLFPSQSTGDATDASVGTRSSDLPSPPPVSGSLLPADSADSTWLETDHVLPRSRVARQQRPRPINYISGAIVLVCAVSAIAIYLATIARRPAVVGGSEETKLATSPKVVDHVVSRSPSPSPNVVKDREATPTEDRQQPRLMVPKPLAPPPADVVAVDLSAEMLAVGYKGMGRSSIEGYFRFGPADEARRMMSGGGNDTLLSAATAQHVKRVESRAYVLFDLPVFVPLQSRNDIERKGALVGCDVGLRLTEESCAQEGSPLVLCHANADSYWFLTRDQTLKKCTSQEQARYVARNDGVLYHPDLVCTTVVTRLSVSAEQASSMSKDSSDFAMDLVFGQLRFSAIADRGFYRRDALFKADMNSDSLVNFNLTGVFKEDAPTFFRLDLREQPPLSAVTAHLLAATLHDRAGHELMALRFTKAKIILPLLTPDKIREMIGRFGQNDLPDEELNRMVRMLTKAGSKALPELASALKDPAEYRRVRASYALIAFGPAARPASADLVTAINDECSSVRKNTIKALHEIGGECDAAVSALASVAKDEDWTIRENVMETLSVVAQGHPDRAIPTLVEALKDKNREVRLAAAQTLETFGPLAKDAVPALRAAAKTGGWVDEADYERAIKKITGAK